MGRTVVASGSGDHTVRLWDLTTGTAIGDPLGSHARAVNSLAAARVHGRAVLAAGCDDQVVPVWDLAARLRP